MDNASVIELDKVQNDVARITFLFNRINQDAQELLKYGVTLNIEEIENNENILNHGQ